MELIPYALEIGQLNTSHDLAKNLRVIKPPYEEDGFYSSEFFFDKRFGLENVLPEGNRSGKDCYDYVDCNGRRYYYYKEEETGKTYIGTFNGSSFVNVTPDGFVVNDNSPLRLVKGIGGFNTNHAVGEVGSTIVRTIYRGEYDKDTSYAINDIVIYGGEYYSCKLAAVNQVPTNTTYWSSIASGLPASFTLYTLTFTSNLDNNPCVITVDGKDILIWEGWFNNEELARDSVLANLKLVFPAYTIYREGLKYIFKNGSTPINIAINSSTNKLKQVEFGGIQNSNSKVTVVVDGVTHTTEGLTDYASWLYAALDPLYKVKKVGTKVILAENVGVYSSTNTIGDDIVITKTEYNRYTYLLSAYKSNINPSSTNLGGNQGASECNFTTIKQTLAGVEYTFSPGFGVGWNAAPTSVSYNFNNFPDIGIQTIYSNNTYWIGLLNYVINTSSLVFGSIYTVNATDWHYGINARKSDYSQITFTGAVTRYYIGTISPFYYDYNSVGITSNETNNKTTITISNVNLNGITDGTQESFKTTTIPTYENGYLKISYTSDIPLASRGYIVFTSGVLKGLTVRYEANIESQLFILGTNLRGTKPAENDTFNFYADIGDTIYVGGSDNVYQVFLNGAFPSLVVEMFDVKECIDITSLNDSIFVLDTERVYYSNVTTYSNGDFFVLNFFNIIGGYRLFNIGKAIILFGTQNKLISTVTVGNTEKFKIYDLNYNGNLYSKYSCIFVDQTIMIFQDDKQLLKADINESAKNTFNVNVDQVAVNVRGIFDNISSGEIYFSSQDRYIYLINVIVDGTTDSGYRSIAYMYDKQYTHWTINEYEFKIIKLGNKYIDMTGLVRYGILGIDHISYEGTGFLDFGTITYEQELNFRLGDGERLMMPYIIRTLFGMPDVELNVNLDIAFEIGGKREVMSKVLNGYEHDLRLTSESEIVEDLIGYEDLGLDNGVVYDGNVVGIQNGIYKTGRFVFFKYHGYNRFIIGKSFVLTEKTKVFINELTLVN